VRPPQSVSTGERGVRWRAAVPPPSLSAFPVSCHFTIGPNPSALFRPQRPVDSLNFPDGDGKASDQVPTITSSIANPVASPPSELYSSHFTLHSLPSPALPPGIGQKWESRQNLEMDAPGLGLLERRYFLTLSNCTSTRRCDGLRRRPRGIRIRTSRPQKRPMEVFDVLR